MKEGEEKYLGDDVYASWEGYHIILRVGNQPGFKIYLDDNVRNNLEMLIKEVKKL